MNLKPRTTQLEIYASYHTVPQMVQPQSWMTTIIIRELYQRQMVILATPELNHTRSQHILQCLNGSLCLPISLKIKGSTKLCRRAQVFSGKVSRNVK